MALALPLWLGSCAAGAGFPAGTAASERTATAAEPLTPVPQPQDPPPGSGDAAVAGIPAHSGNAPSGGRRSGGDPTNGPGAGTATEPGGSPPAGVPRTGQQGSGHSESGFGSGGQAQTAVPGAAPSAAAGPSAPARNPEDPPLDDTAGARTVTAYYVLVDDGGSSGVRFGCNDSLVGVRRSGAASAEPLAAAVGALLDGTGPPVAEVYNSLSGSTLEFLSGSFDGTTVTVYLAGTVRPGGTCDVPRIEAQLVQTAVSAVGAIRAEVYVNGVGLAEALSPK
ncbi:MAG: putative lipoprotein [Pseudarthrobacter sp.]|nr:putative lipoprotein [Pseudarthrobacter sp.]